MGDGYLCRTNKNPRLKVVMVSKNYLEYLDNIFGCLSTGVKFKQTAAESAQDCKDRGFSPNAKEENYSDVYELYTASLPEFNDFDWYKSGKKVWPKDIKLTPTVLKHWFVCDGSFNNIISFTTSKEVENIDKIDMYFERVGLPSPSNYYTKVQKYNDNKYCKISFNQSESEELFEYMGEPLPDFGYKWPKTYR
jgi:hypothetical protein